MIATLLTLLGSSSFGAILGGIFAIINRKADIEAKRLDLDHETKRWAQDLQLRAADLEIARQEAQGRKDVAIVEGEATIEAARFSAIEAANKADDVTAEELKAAGKWRWALVLSSAYRKSLRSILTTVVCGAAVVINLVIAWQFIDAWADLDQTARRELIGQALAWISAQASTMITYWFVARGNASGAAR